MTKTSVLTIVPKQRHWQQDIKDKTGTLDNMNNNTWTTGQRTDKATKIKKYTQKWNALHLKRPVIIWALAALDLTICDNLAL